MVNDVFRDAYDIPYMVNDVFRDAYDISLYGKYSKINPHFVDSVVFRAT